MGRTGSGALDEDEGRKSVIKVLIVDDHVIVRQGLHHLIEQEPDMMICGEAEDAAGLFEMLEKEECSVVVLDISLPDRSGLDVLKEVKATRPGLPVVILSIHPREQYAERALRDGAADYIQKEGASEEVVSAIRKAAAGGT